MIYQTCNFARLFGAVILIVTAPLARAQVPQRINFQGRVVVNGAPFDGAGQFKFALVNANGTATYWSNDGTGTAGSEPTAAVSLTVSKGLYSVLLGDATLANMTVIPNSVFNNSEVGLRAWFNDGVAGFQQLIPDLRLAAAPWAVKAASAETATTVTDGAITAAKLAVAAVTEPKLDATLSANLARRNANQTFTGQNTFNAGMNVNGAARFRPNAVNDLLITGPSNQAINIASEDPLGSYTRLMSVTSNGKQESQLQFRGEFSFVAPLGGEFGATKLMQISAAGLSVNVPGPLTLATTDDQPIELKVGRQRALRLEFGGDSDDPDAVPDGAPNVIGGSAVNFVAAGIVGATIAGGGAANYFGSPSINRVTANFGTVGGGTFNTSSDSSATVGGGTDNTSSGTHATVPGGSRNSALGVFSFAAGRRAKPNHDGTFVWADSADAEFASTAANQFLIRASGGVGIGRNPTANLLEVEGNASKNSAGSWLANSDARIKRDVRTVTNALDTLDRVRLVSFHYTDAYRTNHPGITDGRYLNVIAQEFREVFPDVVKGSGEKLPNGEEILQVDTYPLTIYAAAAVQELHQEVERRLKEKDTRIAALEQRLATLEKLLSEAKR